MNHFFHRRAPPSFEGNSKACHQTKRGRQLRGYTRCKNHPLSSYTLSVPIIRLMTQRFGASQLGVTAFLVSSSHFPRESTSAPKTKLTFLYSTQTKSLHSSIFAEGRSQTCKTSTGGGSVPASGECQPAGKIVDHYLLTFLSTGRVQISDTLPRYLLEHR